MQPQTHMATPYFLIHAQKIDEALDTLAASLKSRWPEGIIGYSFKTNNLPWLISHMKGKGLWAEVVSSDEYRLAKALGYTPEHIVFNGPVKDRDTFIEAVEQGAIVNLDAKRELRWLLQCRRESLAKARIGLRVNFCVEEYCPGESQGGQEDGRFGFSYETGELKAALDFLAENRIPLSGLHLHCSSKTRSLNIYDAIARVAVGIAEEYQLNLQYLDIGGGFFGGMPNKPGFEDYLALVEKHFKASPRTRDVNVIVEPGMSVVGANIEYVASVTDVKQTKNNLFVTTDGSRIHIDPLMRKTGYAYRLERLAGEEGPGVAQILGGFTCMEGDRFFTLEAPLLQEGDRIHFDKVGAYTMGMSPQFIEFYPPVYAQTDGGLVLARPKATARDFIKE